MATQSPTAAPDAPRPMDAAAVPLALADGPAGRPPARAPGVQSPLTPALLARHSCQGSSNDCGPYAVAMIIAALRGAAEARPPELVARAMERPRPRAVLGIFPLIRRLPGSATFPWGVVDIARQAGLAASWRPLASRDRLLACLVRGEVPVVFIGGWRPRPWGHVTVLVAWDAERGWGFADSLSRQAEVLWRPDDVFRRQWRALGQLLVTVRQPPTRKEPGP